MRALPRLGSFDLVTCLDDAVNHLPGPADALAALRGMRANLADGGLLVFDVNLLAAYAGAGDAVIDGAGQVVLWRGAGARATRSGGLAEIRVDLFSERADGLWSRRTMCQAHRHYPLDEMRSIARSARLRVLAVCGQGSGGVLADSVDEARDRKALFLLSRA